MFDQRICNQDSRSLFENDHIMVLHYIYINCIIKGGYPV